MATGPQLTKLAIHRNQIYGHQTRDPWFTWIEQEIGRRITSNRELTTAEAAHILTILQTVQNVHTDQTHADGG